jgi:hypothetical protein
MLLGCPRAADGPAGERTIKAEGTANATGDACLP